MSRVYAGPMDDFLAALNGALKDGPSYDAVRLEREDGTEELLLYAPDDGADGGTLIIPAETMTFTPPADRD